jgi:Ca2+-binding RTX toxin-like protein
VVGAADDVADTVQQTITGIVINYNGEQQFIDLTAPLLPFYTIGGNDFSIVENGDGSVDVSGVVGGNSPDSPKTQIGVFTADGYNALEYTWAGGDEFKIGDFGASVPSTDPVNFQVPIAVVDGDGDIALSNIGITLTTSGAGIQDYSASGSGVVAFATESSPHIVGSNFADALNGNASPNVLSGGAGADTISGGGGNDVLIAGGGNDSLTGGAGADTFVLTSASSNVTITDYSGVGGHNDVIDLKGLFSAPITATTSNFVSYDSGTGALSVDPTGTGANFTQVATLVGPPAAATLTVVLDQTHTVVV